MILQKEAFLDQLAAVVSFASLSGEVSQNASALDYVETLLHPKASVQRVKNGSAEILLASTQDTLRPAFGYLVHIDVVAASPSLFTLREEEGKVFGRGVSDMKFSIPLGVALLNELIDTESTLSFTLAITTDEEIGGFGGAAHLAEEMQWRPEVLIVPDGGDNLRFVRAAKGVAQFRISVSGVSAHASRPWLGKNAIPLAAEMIARLQKKFGAASTQESWKTTLNFGSIQGGISTNQVCDSVQFTLDFRYPETDSLERIESEVFQIVQSIQEGAQVQRLSTGLPTATDPGLPVVQRFLRVVEAEFGQRIPIEPTYGASDARHFARFGTPVLMIKPVGGDIHMESEWLDVESTMRFYEAIRTFLKNEARGNNE